MDGIISYRRTAAALILENLITQIKTLSALVPYLWCIQVWSNAKQSLLYVRQVALQFHTATLQGDGKSQKKTKPESIAATMCHARALGGS